MSSFKTTFITLGLKLFENKLLLSNKIQTKEYRTGNRRVLESRRELGKCRRAQEITDFKVDY